MKRTWRLILTGIWNHLNNLNANELKKAPVALFLWKRPDNAREILSKIIGYGPPEIYLVIDGPRNPDDAEAINAVKKVINELLGDSGITFLVNASDVHLGLFKRFTSGFDWIFSFANEIIILEDDTVPGHEFFNFCNVYLERFRGDKRIVAINGSMVLSDKEKKRLNIDGPFLKKQFGPWGWATWRDKFVDTYRPHTSDISFIKKIQILFWVRNLDHFFSRYKVFKSVVDGTLNVWSVQFRWNIMEQKKFVLCSHMNLISNVGLDEHAATQFKDWNGILNIPISERAVDWEKFTEFNCIHDYENVIFKRKTNKQFVISTLRKALRPIFRV